MIQKMEWAERNEKMREPIHLYIIQSLKKAENTYFCNLSYTHPI